MEIVKYFYRYCKLAKDSFYTTITSLYNMMQTSKEN